MNKSKITTFCNPLNLSYKFQHYAGNRSFAHREAADPTIILFKDRYYIFASMSAGFWHSTDLADWEFHPFINELTYDYAPDVRQVGDYIYLSASRSDSKCPIYRTKDPLSDNWELVSSTFIFWDPDMFCDDDGRVYFYWGCSNESPIWGIELDPEDMTCIGGARELIHGRPDALGYERVGDNASARDENGQPLPPYIEGAFMNKHNGKYYLQYACPGTEFNIYSDGVYVSDNPLGPFELQHSNPFSSVPGGFITGAGHGSTIQDKYGNWWHAATMRISVNHIFERRIGLFPAGFDENGVMFCNQNFADYPITIPEGRFDPWQLIPKWMLLSYKKAASASSFIKGHEPDKALNENIRSWWCAETNNPGEWFMTDLGDIKQVHAIQINFAEESIPSKNEIIAGDNHYRLIDVREYFTRYLLEGSTDGNTWFVLEDKRNAETDLSHDFIVFEDGKQIRYIKITAYQLPYDQKFALSGLRVFGIGKGEKPGNAVVTQAQRYDENGLDAHIKWTKVENAQGYNVRYGNSPDKLYHSWLVYEDTELDLPMLIKGEVYYVCIDSFNENGITPGTAVKIE